MAANLVENDVELAALDWFQALDYSVVHGPHIAPGEPSAERDSFAEVVLVGRLREAIRRLNPAIPEDARAEALRKVLRVGTPSLTQTNRAFHRMLRDGIPVEFIQPEPSPQPSPTGRGGSKAEGEGQRRWDIVRLIDFDDVRGNDWLAVNQFTVIEGAGSSPAGRGGGEGIGAHRRPDIVVFVNGLPLGLIELKNAADEDATIWSAYAQLQTYKAEIPTLLHYNAALVVTDDEKAFYDALATNDSAVQAMGDAKLKVIAAELITQVKKSVTIDWTLRESARARIKVMVKRILNKHGYPPDLQEEAVKTVLAQAELLCAEWV